MDSPSHPKNIMKAPPSDDPFADMDIVQTKELPSPMEFGTGMAVPVTASSVESKKDEPPIKDH